MYRNYKSIFGKLPFPYVPQDLEYSRVGGSSLTIPGLSSNLKEILASIDQLPPVSGDYDFADAEHVDMKHALVSTQLESMYKPEAVNAAQDAKNRQEQSRNGDPPKEETDPGAEVKEE